MSILDDLLKDVESSELDEKIKKTCDKIMIEEAPKFKYSHLQPKGPNILLSIEYEITNKKVNFLCLEREMKEKYIISIWSANLDPRKELQGETIYPKRIKVFDISNETKFDKILKSYAEVMKYLKGV